MPLRLRRFMVTCLGLVICLVGSQVSEASAEDGWGDNCFTHSCVYECPDEEVGQAQCDACADYEDGWEFECFYTSFCSTQINLVEPYCWEGPGGGEN